MMGVKNSKRWCAAPCGRDVPIWEKFDYEEDKDKRVYLPRFRMRKSDVAYIKEAARRHGVSASRELESILTRVFSFGMLGFPVIQYRSRDRKRKRPSFEKGSSQRRPKFTLHPSFLRLLQDECDKKEIGISLLFYEIFVVYRQKYPIHLGSSC